MHYLSKDFAVAIVPLMSSEQKEIVEDFLCKNWKINRIEFFAANQPDIYFAHGLRGENTHRFLSRVGNSLGWQDEKRVAFVSCHPAEILTDGEQNWLLTHAVSNLKKKFPAVMVEGLILKENKPAFI